MKRAQLTDQQEPKRYANDWDSLEALFREREDPWDFLTDAYEQARLRRLAELVRLVAPSSVLEVGCAEGIFTEWLARYGAEVVALDVSSTACQRARRRAPQAQVLAVPLDEYSDERRFDLVVCAETLYYVGDVPAALAKMQSLGRKVLVSYTRNERRKLDRALCVRVPAIVDETFKLRVRRFPPKTRACRMILWDSARQ